MEKEPASQQLAEILVYPCKVPPWMTRPRSTNIYRIFCTKILIETDILADKLLFLKLILLIE